MLLRAVRCAPRSSAGLARRLVNCAAQYRTKPEWLADNTEDVECEILYVVGGLYGNAFALEALRTVLKAEIAKNPENDIAVVFNGDFNFFNATPEAWVAINAAVHGRVSEGMGGRVHAFATRGNVEAEVSAAVCVPDAVIGCGCAYPKKAGPALEANATAIVQQLHAAACEADAAGHEWIAPWLKSLPFTRTFQVGDARVAAIHGDATCVNGWRFAADALESGPPRNGQLLDATLSSWLERAEVDIFASTHTCLPVFKKLEQGECAKVAGQCTSTKGGIVANNGAYLRVY